MRKIMIAGAIAATAVATPALAQTPTIIFTNGVYTAPPYTTAQIFQNFNNGSGLDTPYTAKPGSGEIVTGNVRSETNSVPPIAQDPNLNDGANKYISILGGASYFTPGSGVAGGPAVQFFSFILGSLDSYNALTLTFDNGISRTYTGAQIIGQATALGTPGTFDGNGNSNIAGRVNFDMGGQAGIRSALFTSTQASFEVDDLASAVPEPAAWGMMILGFGLVGSQLRTRRQRQTKLATA